MRADSSDGEEFPHFGLVEIFRRTSSGTWEYFEVREGNVRLASGPMLDLAVLYADLPV